MGVIFTHGITDNTRALSVGLVRSIVQLDHRVQHTPLHRLQAVSHIGKGPSGYYAHGIVDV